jgi:DNA-binding transcriptional ArsR family regulator
MVNERLANERLVNDAATLKALADPLRLAILGVLVRHDPEPLTAKELAAELDEPQTKLYRHLKQLEKVELIAVAGTRLVSGIVESRYRVRQEQLQLSSEIFAPGSAQRPGALAAMLAALEVTRRDFERDYLADRVDFRFPPQRDALPQGDAAESNAVESKVVFRHSTFRLSPGQAQQLSAGLLEVLAQAREAEEQLDPAAEAVEVKLFTLLYGLRPEA